MRGSRSARIALTTLWVTATSSICAHAHAACGDGVLDAVETCDDRNLAAGDGCTASCQREAGYVCSGAPSTCCFQDAASAYVLLGDASYTPEQGIITLTPEAEWKSGTAWYRTPLDFSQPFTISLLLYLGTRDEAPMSNAQDLGADGGAILFQRDARGLGAKGEYSGPYGEDGGELGARGLMPVVGVEFDTYNNGEQFGDVRQGALAGDEDHIAVFQGRAQPASNQLAPAVCMNDSSVCNNYEDGQWHRFDVRWSGGQGHQLTVAIDGVQRIDLVADLVANHFGGDPHGITFGLAASTGGHTNLQRFCPLAPQGFGVPRDLDQDGMDDAVDADSDGDGASDGDETGGVFATVDPDQDLDRDGVPNYRDADFFRSTLGREADCPDLVAPIGACDGLIGALDFDHDGIADHLDLDTDGDGAPDATDSAPRDACVPMGSARCVPVTMNGAGPGPDGGAASVADGEAMRDAGRLSEGPSPGDLDGDQVANEVDLAPSDPCLPNKNVLACASGDLDADGLSNVAECPALRLCPDGDGDGVPDYADPGSQGAPAKRVDGCALAGGRTPPGAVWLVLLWLSVRTSLRGRSGRARADVAPRSLPWFRGARHPRRETRRWKSP